MNVSILHIGGHGGQLFTYLQTIQSYLAPPTFAVFLVGMLWPRLTEKGKSQVHVCNRY